MEKNYAKHLGFSVLPTSNSKELHQPPDLSKSEWLQGMGDRARLQGSWMPRRATDIFDLAKFLAKQKMSHLKAQRTNHTHHKLAIASGEPALSRPVSTEQSSLDNSHIHMESYRKANMSFSRRRNGHLDDVEAPHTLPLFRLVLPKTPLPQCQVSAPSSLSWVKTTYVPHLQHINGTDPLRKRTWEVGITAVL